MNKLYFENITEVGDLYLEYIFYTFESEPILFTCSDKHNNIYFCLCSDIRYEQKWLIAECNINKLSALIHEETDIISVFLESPKIIIITMDIQDKESSKIISPDKVDLLDLPKDGVYLRCDKEKAQNYLWNKEYERLYLYYESAMKLTAELNSVTEISNSITNYFITVAHECMSSYDILNTDILIEKTENSFQTIWQHENFSSKKSININKRYNETKEKLNILDSTGDDLFAA